MTPSHRRIGPLPTGGYDLCCAVDGRGRLAQAGIVRAATTVTVRGSPLRVELRLTQ